MNKGSHLWIRKLSRTEEELNVELNRTIWSEWNAFRKHAEILKGNLPSDLKRFYNEYILPVIKHMTVQLQQLKEFRHESRLELAHWRIERALARINRNYGKRWDKEINWWSGYLKELKTKQVIKAGHRVKD